MPLPLVIPEKEFYDERINRFVVTKYTKLELEHSLISISKWEAKWHKAYLSRKPKTDEEFTDYIRCMCTTRNVDPNVFYAIDQRMKKRITDYIADSQTATVFPKRPQRPPRESMTNELIYFWMTYYNIPFDPCAKWHLNHLLTLIETCAVKSQAPKKRGRQELAAEWSALNAQRRAKYNTRG